MSKGGKKKYWFNPCPKIVFENKLEYALFRKKVEQVAKMLGFSSMREMLAWMLKCIVDFALDEKELESIRKSAARKIMEKMIARSISSNEKAENT